MNEKLTKFLRRVDGTLEANSQDTQKTATPSANPRQTRSEWPSARCDYLLRHLRWPVSSKRCGGQFRPAIRNTGNCERTPATRNSMVSPIRKPLYVGTSPAVAILLICACEMTNRSVVREKGHDVMILEDGLVQV